MTETEQLEDPVFDIRYFREPEGFVNLGIHIDYISKNYQLFVGRWHISVGWHRTKVSPNSWWTSLLHDAED